MTGIEMPEGDVALGPDHQYTEDRTHRKYQVSYHHSSVPFEVLDLFCSAWSCRIQLFARDQS